MIAECGRRNPATSAKIVKMIKIYWSILLVAAGFACLVITHCWAYRKQIKEVEQQLKQFKDGQKD